MLDVEKKMKKVSVYIPCFNAGKYLALSLQAVIEQTYPVDEILIIDDGSTDDTVKIASKFPVKIISHEKNKGLAAARNTAFRVAANEFVAALDADCVAEPDWLARLMRLFTDEAIAGVGGRLVEKYSSTLADQWRAQHMVQHWGQVELEDPPFLFGSNMVMRRSVLLALGGYNERFRTNYEDVYLSEMILDAGFHLIYSSTAVAHHLRTDTIRSVLKSFWQWNFHYFSKSIRRSDGGFFSCLRMVIDLAPNIFRLDSLARRHRFLIIDLYFFLYIPLLWVKNHFAASRQ